MEIPKKVPYLRATAKGEDLKSFKDDLFKHLNKGYEIAGELQSYPDGSFMQEVKGYKYLTGFNRWTLSNYRKEDLERNMRREFEHNAYTEGNFFQEMVDGVMYWHQVMIKPIYNTI